MSPNKAKLVVTETSVVFALNSSADLVIREKQPRPERREAPYVHEMTKTTFCLERK